jgi:hypothetical protein
VPSLVELERVMSFFWTLTWILLAYVVIGIATGRIFKQVEFNDAVKVLKNCDGCLDLTKRLGELSWCRAHYERWRLDSSAVAAGIFWPVAILIVVGMFAGMLVSKIIFPGGQLRNKESRELLTEITADRKAEALAAQEKALKEQHKELGISWPGEEN